MKRVVLHWNRHAPGWRTPFKPRIAIRVEAIEALLDIEGVLV